MKKGMTPILTIVAAMLLAAGCGGNGTGVNEGGGPDRIPFVIADDFETGELHAWESYPYAQDIGYDPRLLCQEEPAHNGSRYALARIVMPNDAIDLSGGFTKEIDLWTAPDTRLRFALFLIADRKPRHVDVSLGLFDGRLYTHRLDTPDVNRWLEVDIPMEDFMSDGQHLKAGEHVQAVAIETWYPLVTHLASYTVLIDDVSLNGERTRRFIADDPGDTFFDKFGVSVLDRHFFHGERFSLAVHPEGAVQLSSAACTLIAPDSTTAAVDVPLYDDGTHGDAKAGDGIWSNDAIHEFTASDRPGQWSAALTGSRRDGGEVSWRLGFIMPGRRLTKNDHPRLFFTTGEFEQRLASETPAQKAIRVNATGPRSGVADADVDAIEEGEDLFEESLTGGPYSRVSAASSRWRVPLARLGSIIERGAWHYAFTGDTASGETAKKALLKLCSFKRWNNPWMEKHGRHIYFPVGYMIKQVAIGYDLLHPLMTDEERAVVRHAIMSKAIEPFHRDMVEMDRMPSSLSNHIAVIVAGVGLAATAIYGDDENDPYLEPCLSGILTKMKTFIDRTYFPGGGYGEPYTYQAMASRDLTETLYAMERCFGIDYTTTTNIRDLWIYPLYATHASSRYPDFGDVSHYYGMTQTHFLWLSHRMKNPWTYAYTGPYLDAGKGGHLGWLWYTDGIEPRYRTELPTSRLFPRKGHMVMRSDWEDDGSIIIFKCGPNSNHYHLDQGTFAVMTAGDYLLSDAGHSSSYYANLYYPCYYTQAIGHNVMLVDMNPESQAAADYGNGIASLSDYPEITTSFASDIADNVEGDLTCVYKGAVTRYTRSLLYMKPGPVFLLDRVWSDEGHEYNWLFHAEHSGGKSSITVDDTRVLIDRPKARMTMDVLSPAIAGSRVRDSDRDESFVALSSAPDLKEATFLAAMVPEAASSKPAVMTSEALSVNGWTGARTTIDDNVFIAMFTNSGEQVQGVAEDWDVDAERFAIVRERGTGTIGRFFLRGSRLADAETGAVIISGTVPASTAVAYTGDNTIVEYDTLDNGRIEIMTPVQPSRVTTGNGNDVQWEYDDGAGTVTLDIRAGRHRLLIR